MAGYVIVGMLAAFGLLCAVWFLWGLFTLEGETGTILWLGGDVHSFAQRYIWLREMGFVRGRLVIVAEDLSAQERQWLEAQEIELCSREALAQRLGIGAEAN